MRRGMVLVAAVLTLSSLVVGCSKGVEDAEGTDNFMDLAGVQAEYDATVKDFPYTLPNGISFPKKVIQPQQEAVYEKGSGLVQAYQFWECAWMDRALTSYSSDEKTTFDSALAQLENGLSSVYRTQHVIDPDKNWENKAIGQAKLGDLSNLKGFYDADCQWYRTETAQ